MRFLTPGLLLALAPALACGADTAGAAAAAVPSMAAAPPTYALERTFELGGPGGWDTLTVDPGAGRLYISRADRVLVMSTADGTLAGTIPGTAGVHGIAVVPALGKGYTSNGRSDSLTVFDSRTLATLGTIAVPGHNPDVIIHDPASRRVYSFNGRSQDVDVIDPAQDKVVASIGIGGKPEFAVSDGAGRIFVNVEDKAQIVVIDTRAQRTLATWALAGCEEPTGLALDAAHQRLFSACQNGVLAVTDAASGRSVARVPIGKGPDGAAFDAARAMVFTPNGEDGTLSVIHEDDPDHYTLHATVATQKSARTLALDPSSGRIYVVAARFGQTPTPSADQPHPRPPVLEGSFRVLVVAPSK